jgi:hypothetical protein
MLAAATTCCSFSRGPKPGGRFCQVGALGVDTALVPRCGGPGLLSGCGPSPSE